jgi:processive 1,2-diacylglycerol beta-glucosyltransferase
MPEGESGKTYRPPRIAGPSKAVDRDGSSAREQAPALSTLLRDRNGTVLRVLVLTSRTGGGHDARAEAFRDWVLKLYGSAVDVRIDHTLEDSSTWNRLGVDFYNLIQRRAPFLHHIYYHIGEIFGVFQHRTVSVGLRYYDRLIREFQPDIILSVHSILNRGYFRHAKSCLTKPVFCVTYCGEFRGSYGFSRNWVTRDVDLFLGRTDKTLHAATKTGLPLNKGQCLGHLLKPAFYEPPLGDGEREEYLRKELGLDPGRFTLLLATGGAGAQNHLTLLRRLLPFGNRLQVVALCGQSNGARRRLELWSAAHPGIRLAALPFSDQMHRLLQVASAVVTRPGTTTSAEALQLGCPILFNRIGGTMPQEFCTLRYFQALDLAPDVHSPADLERRIRHWLDQPEDYERYRARFRAARTEDDPEALVRTVLGVAVPGPAAVAGPPRRPAGQSRAAANGA